jgi:hypothetical protein
VDNGSNKARLAEFASTCGFEPANRLGVEANANDEQNWLSIDLADWNNSYVAVDQRVRDSFR